jgi:hypothetical protein
MYHAKPPNGCYEMTNRVAVFDPPRAISWEPGQDVAGDGKPQFGGWTWRYDLVATEPSHTEVTPPTTGPRYRRSCANTSRSRRSPWTTSPARCATSPSWSNRPQRTVFRHAVTERIETRRPLGHLSMSSPAPERKESP